MPTAFVTGAGVRVGRAIAEALAEAGYDLALHANRSRDALSEVAATARACGREATLYTADLADPSDVDRLAAEVRAAHPVLDIVVHNAALFEKVRFGEVTRAQYERLGRVNLEAPFFLTQALLSSLRAAEDGLVVHITDIMGERATRGYAHYGITKAALLYLTRALAVELAPDVRVNGVSPGTVAFPEDFDEEQRARVLRRIPLGREGACEDIAKAVLFFAAHRYVTGQVLAVDGGRSAVL